jgi:hypothetical protein
VEISELIVASAVYNQPADELVQPSHVDRLRAISEKVFEPKLIKG